MALTDNRFKEPHERGNPSKQWPVLGDGGVGGLQFVHSRQQTALQILHSSIPLRLCLVRVDGRNSLGRA
jgi:hypothetical protein